MLKKEKIFVLDTSVLLHDHQAITNFKNNNVTIPITVLEELDKFKEFISASIGKYTPIPSMQILQDGGELMDQPLSEQPDEIWQDFQEDFLGKKSYRNRNCKLNLETPD